jgi:GLPGLI family protein
MKKLIYSAFVCLTILTSAYGQLKEGHIQYDMQINMDPDDPSAEMMSTMMEGSTLDIYFQDLNSRSEIQMGKMLKMTVIVDSKSGNSLTLMSGMLGKKAIKGNINDAEFEENEEDVDYEIKLLNETKTILGYTCKKALIIQDGNEMTAWYTEDFTVYKKGINFMQEQVPGAPLEFEMNMNGLGMKVTAKSVEKSLSSKKLFDLTVPDGYEVTSLDELNQMGGY